MRLTAVAVAATIVLAVTACDSGSAKPGSDPSATPAKPTTVARPLPEVNRPCHGKIPEPFAGVATNVDLARTVASLQRSTGAHIRVAEFYGRFPGNFQSAAAEQVVDVGALPLIQLNPRHVSLAQVAAGAYDGDIRSYAAQVKAFGCYIILSFGHEMNGWWYPWGLPSTSPATFKAAWRHIHDIFSAERVRNVIWSFDPTHQYAQRRPGETAYPASKWYPGNKYVDWIGIDGYLGRGQNFRQVFGHQLRDIRSVTRKPVYLAETGVGNGSHVVKQMASLFAGIRLWRLIGLVWFDINRKNSWSLQGSPVKDAAFRRGVAGFG